jgi:hypothetical protein
VGVEVEVAEVAVEEAEVEVEVEVAEVAVEEAEVGSSCS